MKEKRIFYRCMAFFTDLVFISIIFNGVSNGLQELLPHTQDIHVGDDILYGILMTSYFLGCDLLNKGNTPGKDLIRLHLTGPDGNKPALPISLARTMIKLLGVAMLPVSIVCYFWKGREFTLHDFLAGTTVVSITSPELGSRFRDGEYFL